MTVENPCRVNLNPTFERIQMKATTITMLVAAVAAVAALAGCQSTSSARGGSMQKERGFTIASPTRTLLIRQGQTQNVPIALERGDYFKQDVKLQIDTTAGLSVDPSSVTVKASDSPDLQLSITAAPNAAIGDYRVSVRATPQTGEPTTAVFIVKVASP